MRHRPCGDRYPSRRREDARGPGHQPSRDRPRGLPRAGLGVEGTVRRRDHQPAEAPWLHPRLLTRAVHARRGVRRGGAQGVRRALREGLHLPRPVHGQLGSGPGLGRLGPGGRGPRGHRLTRLNRLPADRRLRRDRRRHRASRDDARRYGRRGQPRGRALRTPDRSDRHATARRAGVADRRRRARGPGVRDRRPQGDARTRPQ